MKIVNKIYAASLALAMMQTGCTDGFEEMNRNPSSLPEVDPRELLYTAETQMLTPGHCWNAIYASKYRWMQYGAGIWGYYLTNYSYWMNSIGSTIYDEYINMGSYVTNMGYLADRRSNSAAYDDLKQIGRILLIAKGIQTSDLYGSLVYSEGWRARDGQVDDASMTPAFETQEQLADVWDRDLKACIATLGKSGSAQAALKGYDRTYNGDMQKWIRAANGLRLRLASRLWKRKPDVAKSIAAEVLASGNVNNVFGGNGDSFVLWFDKLYTNIHYGDWHSVKDMEIATYTMIDYLNRNSDPRRRMYFIANNLTAENVARFNAEQSDTARLIPEDYTRWEGSTVSYDKMTTDRRRTRYYLGTGSSQTDMRPANMPQVRLWKGNDTDGNGANWAPVMTYADFCFLAAEFVLREGIPSVKTARQWYDDGVRASLDHWNSIGKYCDIAGYEAMTDSEIADFLAKDDIKWNADRALEQIYAQTYIEHYKNVDEMYAFWKRTNYPNWSTSTIIRFERPVINGVSQIIPRRAKFTYPNDGVHNYDNLKKRIDDMKADAQFGEIDNEYGRLWWDSE